MADEQVPKHIIPWVQLCTSYLTANWGTMGYRNVRQDNWVYDREWMQ